MNTTTREASVQGDSSAHLAQLRNWYHKRLFDDCIPFWLNKGADPLYGGVMTCIDRQGNVIDTDKAVWLQGRFAWMLGHLYNTVQGEPAWREHTAHTIEFLLKHCYDHDGRMFFHVTRQGAPIRRRRYAFSESFAAIALGEYARMTGDSFYAEKAESTYRVFADHQPETPKFCGTRPMKSIGQPMIDIATCQCLRDSIQLPDATARIDAAIAEIQRDFMKPDLRCCMESVSPLGEIVDHLDGRMLNPGHAIEGAWFIMREGKLRGKREYIDIGLEILDWMWERGWDKEYGGILYFRDLYDLPVAEYWQDMKFWWPQNEALIATLLAWQVSGNIKYLNWHYELHKWFNRHMVDHEYGECYGYLSRDCRVTTPLKGSLFKGCFHYPRQLLECLRICDELLG